MIISPSLSSQLFHQVHHDSRALLLGAPGCEPLGAVRTLGLADHHDPRGPARLLLNVHCLQFGDQTLGTLGCAEMEDI